MAAPASTPAGDVSTPSAADGPMPGGTANRGLVERVGSTVRRPPPPCGAAPHPPLGPLAAAGFDGAPGVLATDAPTETLTYINGRAAVPPLLDEKITEQSLARGAELLRRDPQPAGAAA